MYRIALAGVLAGCSVMLFAQQPGAQNNSATQTNAKQLTIQGCVTGGARYTFMQAGTGAIFELEGDPGQLAPAQGKLSEVTAREVPPKSGELPRLEVTGLRIVAARCPIQAEARPAGASTSTANPPSPVPKSPATTPYASPGAPNQTPPGVETPNVSGASGTPSPGTGNAPSPQTLPPPR